MSGMESGSSRFCSIRSIARLTKLALRVLSVRHLRILRMSFPPDVMMKQVPGRAFATLTPAWLRRKCSARSVEAEPPQQVKIRSSMMKRSSETARVRGDLDQRIYMLVMHGGGPVRKQSGFCKHERPGVETTDNRTAPRPFLQRSKNPIRVVPLRGPARADKNQVRFHRLQFANRFGIDAQTAARDHRTAPVGNDGPGKPGGSVR